METRTYAAKGKSSSYCSRNWKLFWNGGSGRKRALICVAGTLDKNGETQCYSKFIGRGQTLQGPLLRRSGNMFQRDGLATINRNNKERCKKTKKQKCKSEQKRLKKNWGCGACYLTKILQIKSIIDSNLVRS